MAVAHHTIKSVLDSLTCEGASFARHKSGIALYWQVLSQYINKDAVMSFVQADILAREIVERYDEKEFTVMETIALATYINSCR